MRSCSQFRIVPIGIRSARANSAWDMPSLRLTAWTGITRSNCRSGASGSSPSSMACRRISSSVAAAILAGSTPGLSDRRSSRDLRTIAVVRLAPARSPPQWKQKINQLASRPIVGARRLTPSARPCGYTRLRRRAEMMAAISPIIGAKLASENMSGAGAPIAGPFCTCCTTV